MSKITEEEIIQFLQERIEKLNKDLKKTQAALEALTGVPLDDAHKPDKKDRKIIKAAKKEIKKHKSADEAAITIVAPETFDSSAKLQDKIAYALSQTGPAFKDELVSKLHELEPESDLKKLDKSISLKLSLLYQNGSIKAEKVGKKYKYSF